MRNLVFLPVQLSIDADSELQALTEGRLCFWSHAVAPDYLRTKPEPQVEIRDQQIYAQLQQRLSNPETVQKQINFFNRCLTNILENLQNSAKDDVETEGDYVRKL
ncbi:unnamed protein product [Soboliphyme baturini]|uniref:Mediator of RNA polymerase II transcription subunit 8 n=1 Tax=Soboliphyme baturini TaxID=241478 RepID=A0A183JAR8_9BILA|nr:unnamed protein product [Soboliphyme baturini]